MEPFHDRFHAGQFLAAKLQQYRGTDNLLVLGLPRGGVPVAFEVARALESPLDVFLVRKLGLPGHRELAMGAISTGGVRVLNREVVESCRIPHEVIDKVTQIEQRELERQEQVYRQNRPRYSIAGRVVILVDDGLATGSTMRAAVRALRQHRPQRIVVAVPVGAADTCEAMQDVADEVISAISPTDFIAVGAWYEDFSPITDETVSNLLGEAGSRRLSEKAGQRDYPTPENA